MPEGSVDEGTLIYCSRCGRACEIKGGDDERLLLSCGHVAVYENSHGTWDVI